MKKKIKFIFVTYAFIFFPLALCISASPWGKTKP